MTAEIFKNKQFAVFIQNQKLTIALVVSMLLNLVLVVVFAMRATSERVVFLPPFQTTTEFEITGNKVSATYLEQMARYIVEVLYNVTPDNARLVKPTIAPLVPSNDWQDVDRALTQQISYLVNNSVTRIFHTTSIKWDEPNALYVYGILRDMSNGVVTSSKAAKIKINYRVSGGRFWLLGVQEVDNK